VIVAPPGPAKVDCVAQGTGLGRRAAGKDGSMRAMFVIWLTLIAAGLVFYSVIGLAHN
jgi:hypothetical protein